MVRVNNKPQHLVFCWYFAHLLSKHRHLPVESRKRPCLARSRAVCFALKPGQISGPGPIPVPLFKGSPSKAPSQGAGLVQNGASAVRIVDIGAPSPAQLPAAGNLEPAGSPTPTPKAHKVPRGLLRGEVSWNQRKCSFFGCRYPAKCSLKGCQVPRECSLGGLRFFETNTVKLAI
jgi:hypothetical protein